MADMFLVKTVEDEPKHLHGVFHDEDDLLRALRRNYPSLRGRTIEFGVGNLDCNEKSVNHWTKTIL